MSIIAMERALIINVMHVYSITVVHVQSTDKINIVKHCVNHGTCCHMMTNILRYWILSQP